jgi:hypothetical protein
MTRKYYGPFFLTSAPVLIPKLILIPNYTNVIPNIYLKKKISKITENKTPLYQ